METWADVSPGKITDTGYMAMEILDRYLQAVRRYLPRRRQDDILEELSVDILAQMEDMEQGLGRSLTEEERVALIKHYGHPMVVATRYMPQHQLIGPSVFPYYWFTLLRGLGLAGVAYVVANGAVWVTGNATGEQTVQQIFHLPSVLVQVAAWITLVFAALEWGTQKSDVKGHLFGDWDPRLLPAVQKEVDRRRWWSGVAELISLLVAMVWWLAVPHFPVLMFGPAVARFAAWPVRLFSGWALVYWTMSALMVVQVIVRAVTLARPASRRVSKALQLAFKVMGLGILAMLLKVRDFLVVTGGGAGAHLETTVMQVNHGLWVALRIVQVLVILDIIWESWKLAVMLIRPEDGKPAGSNSLCGLMW